MEVASATWRKWGALGWGIAFFALALSGVLDSSMQVKVPRITQPGLRNSTDTILARPGKMEEPNGTAKLRDLLAGTQPPNHGVTWVAYCEREVQSQEVFFAISLLAWPGKVKEFKWDIKEGAPSIPGDGQPARYFFLGTPPKEPLPGLHQVGPRMWFRPGNPKAAKS